MAYLIHGEDQVKSRNFLKELKEKGQKKNQEIIILEGSKTELSEIKQACEATSLFGQDKLIIIENLFSARDSKRKKQIIDYLKNEDANIVVWEGKKIDGRKLRGFSNKWKTQTFKLSASIFKFLESLQPNNNYQSVLLLKECLAEEEPEKIFYMLIRQLRLLILAKDLGKKGLSGPGWMKHKFISQADKFTLKQLKENYGILLNIDIDIKTGRSIMPLEWQLEQFISNM